MAKVIHEGPLGTVRGRVGGFVIQNSPGGPTLRIAPPQRPTETKRLTQAQAAFTGANRAWATLTPEVRTYWKSIAAGYPGTSESTASGSTTAKAAFIRHWTLTQAAGGTPSTTPPTEYPFIPIVDVTLYGPDIDPPELLEFTAWTPIKWATFAVWAKRAPGTPAAPGRNRWRIIYDPRTVPPYGPTWTWSSERQLWQYNAFLPRDRAEKLASPSVFVPLSIKVAATYTTRQLGLSVAGKGELKALPW